MPKSVSFPSKLDAWLAALILGGSALALWAVVPVVAAGWSGATGVFGLIAIAAVVLLAVALPVWLLLDTKYTFDSDELSVRSGPFRWSVPLHAISRVRPSRSVLSAPALSLDRIQIDYGNRRILISPKQPQRFIDELRKRSPNARLDGF
jgi:hypothetical protein